jgi:hypothetical protein
MAFTLGANEYYLLGYAAVFAIVMLTLRRGVVPSINDFAARRRRRHAPPGGAPQPPEPVPVTVKPASR